MGEKFNISDVANLRNELIQGGLDSMQSGELLQVFLMGHGYGVSRDAARAAASRMAARAVRWKRSDRNWSIWRW